MGCCKQGRKGNTGTAGPTGATGPAGDALPDRTMIASATLPPGVDPTRWFTDVNAAIVAAAAYPWVSGPTEQANPAHVWVAQLPEGVAGDINLLTGVYVSAMPQDTAVVSPTADSGPNVTMNDLIIATSITYTPTGSGDETSKCLGFRCRTGVSFDCSGKPDGAAKLVFSGNTDSDSSVFSGDNAYAIFDASGSFETYFAQAGADETVGAVETNFAPNTTVRGTTTLRGNNTGASVFRAPACRLLGPLEVTDLVGSLTGVVNYMIEIQDAYGGVVSVGSTAFLSAQGARLNNTSIVGNATAYLTHASTASLTIDNGTVANADHLSVNGSLVVWDESTAGIGAIEGSYVSVIGDLQIGNPGTPGSFGNASLPHFRVAGIVDVYGSGSRLSGAHGDCNVLRGRAGADVNTPYVEVRQHIGGLYGIFSESAVVRADYCKATYGAVVKDDALTAIGELHINHGKLDGRVQVGNAPIVPGSKGLLYADHAVVSDFVCSASTVYSYKINLQTLQIFGSGALMYADHLTCRTAGAISVGAAGVPGAVTLVARNPTFLRETGGALNISVSEGSIADLDGAAFWVDELSATIFDAGSRLSLRNATKPFDTGLATFTNLQATSLIDLRGARIDPATLVGPGPIDRDYDNDIGVAVTAGGPATAVSIDPPFPNNLYTVGIEPGALGATYKISNKLASGFDVESDVTTTIETMATRTGGV